MHNFEKTVDQLIQEHGYYDNNNWGVPGDVVKDFDRYYKIEEADTNYPTQAIKDACRYCAREAWVAAYKQYHQ